MLHVISLLFLNVSADYLFGLADCSASLFVFRDASLAVLHVSCPEEAVSWLCFQRFHREREGLQGEYLIWQQKAARHC